jgi:hypothetical protein
MDCASDSGTCVFIGGGNPTFKGCRFTSSGASSRVINTISSSSSVIVANCTFQLFASYSGSSVIFIGGSGGTFTFVQNHLQGSSLGQPSTVLFGLGASLFAGANTSTAGALRDSSITTFTNIEQAP